MPKKRTSRRGLRGIEPIIHSHKKHSCKITRADSVAGATISISDVKQCLMRVCRPASQWFDPDTMRFFKSKVADRAYYDGSGGAYFVSSEQHRGPRGYTVRHYSNCKVDTVGDLMKYGSGAQAARAAKTLARMWARRR